MKGKYALMLALQTFNFELTLLNNYAKQCSECFEFIQAKLDALCRYIMCDGNHIVWEQWGHLQEIVELVDQLRFTSNQALCNLEKFQSQKLLEQKESMSEYLSMLSMAVKQEIPNFHLQPNSRILFIGSGSFPISPLTLSRETGAEVLCVDIDEEAVLFGTKVADALGMQDKVRFVGTYEEGLAYIRQATHIFIASLVERKYELLEMLKTELPSNAIVILRYGNGLKSLFNYPFEMGLATGWQLTSLLKHDGIYDTAILTSKPSHAKEVQFSEA
ncbi:hypothetical protein DUZ99_00970 [Xylanibacillus composti]|uniref:Nicotianamine synthase-like protein n=1 Tax=Xylanibacillus composti TaxID=1572762 RepID=A0A8J4H4H3_9BACL|nr:hypothetical protein [Xylanibacillus composti]MDT9723590.1 hypothetical protein [Xylanibacillus composti]GIQ68373.1 hypothetical protein XYCOK13_11970 [Xylanibacillus composti]